MCGAVPQIRRFGQCYVAISAAVAVAVVVFCVGVKLCLSPQGIT